MPLSDEPEPRENARVLTLPGRRHLSKPSRRRCVRRSARLPGKAARSAAAQTLRFPTFADIRSGCTGRGTDRFRAAAFFDGKKTPIHRDRPARRTADSLHTFPLRDPLRLFLRKENANGIFRGRERPRKPAETAGLRPRSVPRRFASPAPRSGRQGRNGCPDFRSPSRKRPRSAIFSGRRRQVWNISLNFAGT